MNINMYLYDSLAKKFELNEINFLKTRSLIIYIEEINKYKHDFNN
tara:strand:- start:7240 stop:7374 length:135 start_codon:yes stop_codon:yes gene_type:complete